MLLYRWTKFAANVTVTVNPILRKNVSLQGAAFTWSSHNTTGFSPQAIFQNGILSSPAGSQISLCVHYGRSGSFYSPCIIFLRRISQHHYSGSYCDGTNSNLHDLMSKAYIRGNLTSFAPDIAAVQQKGLTYVLGETSSIACHGAPGVSDTAAAALWGLDYALFAGQLGIARLYFHQGIGYKYNSVRKDPFLRHGVRSPSSRFSPLR